jgi:SsrA-binding protein
MSTKPAPKSAAGIKIVTENRKARHNYHISTTFEAGLVLLGSEVKSLRGGQCSLSDSYVSFQGNEAFLQKAHIPPYKSSSYNNHEPERLRKLLLNQSELNKIHAAISQKGLTCVPIKVYFKGGFAKVEIGLGKGKKLFDKRQDIKTRDVKMQLSRTMRKSKS